MSLYCKIIIKLLGQDPAKRLSTCLIISLHKLCSETIEESNYILYYSYDLNFSIMHILKCFSESFAHFKINRTI